MIWNTSARDGSLSGWLTRVITSFWILESVSHRSSQSQGEIFGQPGFLTSDLLRQRQRLNRQGVPAHASRHTAGQAGVGLCCVCTLYLQSLTPPRDDGSEKSGLEIPVQTES